MFETVEIFEEELFKQNYQLYIMLIECESKQDISKMSLSRKILICSLKIFV